MSSEYDKENVKFLEKVTPIVSEISYELHGHNVTFGEPEDKLIPVSVEAKNNEYKIEVKIPIDQIAEYHTRMSMIPFLDLIELIVKNSESYKLYPSHIDTILTKIRTKMMQKEKREY
ncbi:MAG: hypothetical protein ACOC2U_03255 [bacterium]